MAHITFSYASGLNDSIFGKSQAPIQKLIETRAEAFEGASVLSKVYNMDRSSSYAEQLSTMTAMDGFRPVGEGGAYPVDGMSEGFTKTIEHMTWKDSFAITREAVDDAKILDLRKRPTGFVTAYYRSRENFGANMIIAAAEGKSALSHKGKTFDVTAADGRPLFDKEHPAKGKGKAQSNRFAGEFSIEMLGKVSTAMQNFAGDNGESLALAPDTILIPNDEELKRKVFEAVGMEGTAGYNYHYGMWKVIVWPYLNKLVKGTDKPFILLDSHYNEVFSGAVWLDRVPLEVRSEVAANDDNIWKGYARFGVGFNDWRAFAIGGVTGGTSL